MEVWLGWARLDAAEQTCVAHAAGQEGKDWQGGDDDDPLSLWVFGVCCKGTGTGRVPVWTRLEVVCACMQGTRDDSVE